MSSLNITVKKDKPKANEGNIWVNIQFCKEIIKKNDLGPGFTLQKSDSGSQTFGAIKDSIVFLSWSPPFGTIFATMSHPFSTAMEPREFQAEFKKTYEDYNAYAKDCYSKIDKDPLKWSSAPPKALRRGVGKVKY